MFLNVDQFKKVLEDQQVSTGKSSQVWVSGDLEMMWKGWFSHYSKAGAEFAT